MQARFPPLGTVLAQHAAEAPAALTGALLREASAAHLCRSNCI